MAKVSSEIAAAARWREENPGHDGGVVLIWKGKVYGWKDKLRDAHHEMPGALAIDAEGNIFETQGGNDYDGAKCWVVRNSGIK